MNLNEFLYGKKIEKIMVIRGKGIIPSFIRIIVSSNETVYYLETEVNFRIIFRNQMILCFDDIFLDENHNEMSIRRFRSQIDIEKSLMYSNLIISNKRLNGRKIEKARVTDYGDVTIYITSNFKIHIINDSHLNNSCIFRVLTKEKNRQIVSKGGKEYYIENTIYEIINNQKNGIEISNTL